MAVLSTLGDRPSLHDPHSLDSFSTIGLYNRRDFQILKLFSVNILDLLSYSKFAGGECGVGYVSLQASKSEGMTRVTWNSGQGRLSPRWGKKHRNRGLLELAGLLVSWLSSSGRFPRGPCARYSPV